MTDQNNQQIMAVINQIILSLTIIISLFLILNQVNQFLRIKAIDDCGKISRYEKQLPEDNAKVFYPVLDQYKSCLKDKGY